MTIEALLDRLASVRSHGSRRWSACCPAHADRLPSLSIREDKTRVLIHCFGGCHPKEVVKALGLTMADLFTDCSLASTQRPTRTPQRMDRDDVAFRFELGALDRRLRFEQVLNAVAAFSGDGMNDPERDRLMKAIARAYEDQDRADFLETMADEYRVKACRERTAQHAA